MAKTIIFIHGRSWKPPKETLKQLWYDAVSHSLGRDHPAKVVAWQTVTKEFVYYGNISNEFLKSAGNTPPADELTDTADRQETLTKLKSYSATDFTRATYEQLPGRTSLWEALADTIGEAAGQLDLGQPLVELVAPDMKEYWNPDSDFGSRVREPIVAPLKRAMNDDDEIMVISHSLGTMIAFDTFWKFSHTGEYRPRYTNKPVSLWITIGCPLGDEIVKSNLKGARATGDRCYPSNVRRWINIRAEDDYISHDQTLADDYGAMANLMDGPVQDISIYNLAVRHGKSNPHSPLGFLIHPVMVDILAGWL
jgi:hypothetical protein